MKLFKKFLLLAVVVVTAVVLVGCNKKPDNGIKEKSVLRVGTPGLSGDFIAGFGSSAYDVNVRDLIHGYGTLVETEAGEFVWNTEAVLEAAPTTKTDSTGNKTYTFKLQKDLKWNTGEAITAEDYVLEILLLSSKDWVSIATSANAGIDLVGFNKYRYGNEDPKGTLDPNYTVLDQKFPGVRLLGKYEFSLTVAKASLPYFYETTMVSASPRNVETYLPGFAVKDSKDGAYITASGSTKTISETIAATINDAADGQRYLPTVTSGPYQFLRSNGSGGAIVELNPNFKTNYEGKKPTITEVHILNINQQTDVDQVIAGTVDLVTGVIEGEKIEQAKKSSAVTPQSYMRNGYGLLAMATYFGPTAEAPVRRAIGYLFDRNVFLNEFLGGYGSLVNGPYGEAQWFYQETKAELDSKLTNYSLDVTKANAQLDTSSYKFEKDGKTAFDASKAKSDNSYLRHNAQGVALEINHLGTTDNQVTVLIGLQLEANFWKVGAKFTSDESDFDGLLQNYYYGSDLPPAEQKYHIFNLATNFYSNYDPYYSWHTDFAGTTNNPGGISDPELDAIMEEMRLLEPTQTEEFKEFFVDFTVRWNEILPTLPLYSNEYFDIINNKFTGLKTGPVWSWSKDICDIKVNK